ncbi:unnamed protein product [Oncorhynchus mykiss]|uniref:Uncharacterized protein n=1 Tax=Oncorhynchus mykiss TaxID=8022 RepID=A0A060VR39_ONCMY|nr:unnamed protein product [Oncorhynchus mykiss]
MYKVLCSPTKLCGKGNKRKQDDIDDDEEQQTWVEALSQELEDEEPSVDPDYELSAVDTDSEEYNSQNDTESDIDVSGKVVIDDLKTVQKCSSDGIVEGGISGTSGAPPSVLSPPVSLQCQYSLFACL